MLRFSGSLIKSRTFHTDYYYIFYFMNKQYIIDHHTCTTAKCLWDNTDNVRCSFKITWTSWVQVSISIRNWICECVDKLSVNGYFLPPICQPLVEDHLGMAVGQVIPEAVLKWRNSSGNRKIHLAFTDLVLSLDKASQ
jgi:hypothetical protein